ncbi:HET-domain-containing protein [Neofusicoccum parvum]|uniref:HET-domain-containing protein n=1 Tax=Neofusicoccum parvum TaxID=310453 RepID=A0ACB5SFP2_9PEZI|nr:HET-domain-containing protein [Neofusicoccum parvum]
MCTFEDVKVDGDPCCLFGKLTITGDVRTFQIRSVYPYWWIERCNPTFRGEGVAEYHSTRFDPEHFFLAARHGDTSCHLIPGCWHPDEVVGPETPITFIAVSQCSRPAFGRTGYDRDSYIVHALGLVPAEKATAQQLNGEKQEARLFRRVGHAEFHHCAWFGYWCDHEPGPDAVDVPWLWDPRETVGCGVSGTGRPLFSSSWVADGEGVHAHPIHADPLPGRMAYHGDADVQTLTVEII